VYCTVARFVLQCITYYHSLEDPCTKKEKSGYKICLYLMFLSRRKISTIAYQTVLVPIYCITTKPIYLHEFCGIAVRLFIILRNHTYFIDKEILIVKLLLFLYYFIHSLTSIYYSDLNLILEQNRLLNKRWGRYYIPCVIDFKLFHWRHIVTSTNFFFFFCRITMNAN
jgi:hypothetical protein